MPVMNCTASNTALTVMMPPNPVIARMLTTVRFPFNDVMNSLVVLSARKVQRAMGKSRKCSSSPTLMWLSIDEMCGNVRICPGRVGTSPCTMS